MRVIAGTAKGHHLKSPPGSATRPTTDLVRGAIFSLLNAVAQDWDCVLDLYAGTGALGIEALSRGAGHADFVEQSARCCAVIRENLQNTGLAERARVYCMSVERFLAHPRTSYSVILMDPPYTDISLQDIMNKVTLWSGADKNTVIMIQYSRRVSLAPIYNKFKQIKNRRYGDTCVSFYQAGDEPWLK